MEFKDIVVATEYQTKTGEAKKKYQNIGTLFVYDDGGMGIKLDSIPLNWDGKASVYEKKEGNQRQSQQEDYRGHSGSNQSNPSYTDYKTPQGYGNQNKQMPQQQQAIPDMDYDSIPF